MTFCTNCGVEVSGRYCMECGQSAASTSLIVDPGSGAPYRADRTIAVRTNPPGYVPPAFGVPASTIGATDTNRFTKAASTILTTSEQIAWQGKPSLLYLLPRAIGWALTILFAFFWAAALGSGWSWVLFWMVAAIVHLGKGYLIWKNTLYRVTSQRLEISRGMLSQTVDTIQLMGISQITIHKPFPWGLLGLGDLVIDAVDPSGRVAADGSSPNIRLRGLRDLAVLRDLIHASSNIAGQLWDERRFGGRS